MDEEESTLLNLPIMTIPRLRFVLSLSADSPDHDQLDQLVKLVQDNMMVSYYCEICDQFTVMENEEWVESTSREIENTLKTLNDNIEDAETNLGENEVRLAHLAKAKFLLKIGRKDEAETAFRVTSEKTVGIGQRLDIVLALVRMGFFYDDFDLIERNIEKAKSLIEQGGDWDRRNRLLVYEAYLKYTKRDYVGASELFVGTLSTFTSEEIFSYQQDIIYTVLTGMIALDRVTLKKDVIDAPEVKSALLKMPLLEAFLMRLYQCDYKSFFIALAEMLGEIRKDRYGSVHIKYIGRELRLRAYAQYLESYKSVNLQSMADEFGVSAEYIDREISRFIALGRLDCKIDKVSGTIETTRSDTRNVMFNKTLKQGDALLNRIQKLSRVIHI